MKHTYCVFHHNIREKTTLYYILTLILKRVSSQRRAERRAVRGGCMLLPTVATSSILLFIAENKFFDNGVAGNSFIADWIEAAGHEFIRVK